MNLLDPSPDHPAAVRPRVGFRLLMWLLAAAVTIPAIWLLLGRTLWQGYTELQTANQDAENSAPVGYVGTAYRRTYNDRPSQFHLEHDGRKALWAAAGAGGKAEFYDVTDAAFPVRGLSGGFGKDSIPGVDYPLHEPSRSDRGQRMRRRQGVAGLVLGDGPRAFPEDLLAKIEVVNDRDGATPFVVAFDRGRGLASCFLRTIAGREVTFGTTGYASDSKPLLYDRVSQSLWLPGVDALVCVNGEHKGTKLPIYRTLQKTTWDRWQSAHPTTTVLVGNDRTKPIPAQ